MFQDLLKIIFYKSNNQLSQTTDQESQTEKDIALSEEAVPQMFSL